MGGETARVTVASQVAKAGYSTVLIENGSYLGGTRWR
ncbi:hypothetical protein [Petrimonas sp.]